MIKVDIRNKSYIVDEAVTDEQKEKGLKEVSELAEDSGLLFVYDSPQTVSFWMEDTEVPLDIVFIDEDYEVISVQYGQPYNLTPIVENDVMYVLEVNADSGIKPGDDVDIEPIDETNSMQVIGPNGEVQMVIEGGERIFSRSNTKSLVKLAKKAYNSKSEKDYKALGKRVFKFLNIQDDNEPEYVEK